MKNIVSALFYLTCLLACSNPTPQPPKTPATAKLPDNLLATMRPDDLRGFSWMNPPGEFKFEGQSLFIRASKGSDFFNNPENHEVTASGHFLFTERSKDFVATAQVKPNFSATWNACALMLHIDSTHWIKFGFENSDATGKSIVSVVTKGTSDDSNGAILNDRESIWLRIIKKGAIYAMHWSTDGQQYHMARLSAMPEAPAVKIGIEAQCPVGEPATHEILYFSMEEKTVADLRKGE